MGEAGRPSKYDPKYCEEIVKYFSIEPYDVWGEKKVPNDLPLFCGFAASINVSRDTLLEWTKKHDEFSGAYNKCKELQKNILVVNGLLGLYNSGFAQFTAKNITDMEDKVENKHSGDSTLRVISETVK